ncbi:DUF1707 SHOCT-like domain-containing protein [Actinomadura xylanilytica]|uniref:DUF1707 SHOCT-like domain-containing protein n=1 Tax=Actinomadura xylanilytica TaxID=887459 RepID=UPI0032E47B5E
MNLPEPPSPSEPETPAAAPAEGPSGAAALRASDADRDRVSDTLREALAEGRITPEEHAERIDAVYRAKTYSELEPLLSDLPGAGDAVPGAPKVRLRKDEPTLPPPAPQSTAIVAVFGAAERKGRWLVEPQTTITCVFGGVELDLRQAVLTQREVGLTISCVFGGVEITVPPGVRVVNSSVAVFGGHSLPDDDPLEPDAPVIKLSGMVLFGGVNVTRREPDAPRPDRRAAHTEHVRGIRDSHRRHLEDLRHDRREQRRSPRDH